MFRADFFSMTSHIHKKLKQRWSFDSKMMFLDKGCKCSENIHYTGSGGRWEGFIQPTCRQLPWILRLLLHLRLKTDPRPPLCSAVVNYLTSRSPLTMRLLCEAHVDVNWQKCNSLVPSHVQRVIRRRRDYQLKETDRGGRSWKQSVSCLCRHARQPWGLWMYWVIEGGLPPVHLLHQVCTHQKACPVEAVRAVKTFRRKKKKQHKSLKTYSTLGFHLY